VLPSKSTPCSYIAFTIGILVVAMVMVMVMAAVVMMVMPLVMMIVAELIIVVQFHHWQGNAVIRV
jgi:hypothetical protein